MRALLHTAVSSSSARSVRLLPQARRLLTTDASEFRHNLCTDEWVVYSAARRGRPNQHQRLAKALPVSQLPEHDPSCPFCRGNEHLTPDATLVVNDGDGGEWRLRVVPNKYPAVTTKPSSCGPRSAAAAAGGETSMGDGGLDDHLNLDTLHMVERVDAVGFHEVIVETPSHNQALALADVDGVERVVRAFRARGRSMLKSDPSLRHIMYFKNSGLKAGASLLHPHSQVLGLPIVPNEVVRRQRHAREWFLRTQRNVFDVTLEETLREKAAGGTHRVVLEDEHFVCFVPYAALSPYQLWIVPRGKGAAHFHETSDELLSAFAGTLRQALRCLHFGLDEPDFNLVIRSAALEAGRNSIYRSEYFFRWYCIIVPRLGVGAMGGFEFSTGIQSNSSFPEDDAAYLRGVAVPP